ncbi:MAG: hypothetical protein HPY66_2550 [Firmicutes bacterium]|nr:hypothetical protein [Bacillota bacterium]MDI6705058.1 hypothetical protein [Bacillota bacterium]
MMDNEELAKEHLKYTIGVCFFEGLVKGGKLSYAELEKSFSGWGLIE